MKSGCEFSGEALLSTVSRAQSHAANDLVNVLDGDGTTTGCHAFFTLHIFIDLFFFVLRSISNGVTSPDRCLGPWWREDLFWT